MHSNSNDNQWGNLTPAELATAILAAATAGQTAEQSGGRAETLVSNMASGCKPDPSCQSPPSDDVATKSTPTQASNDELAPIGWQAPLVDLFAAMVRRLWLALLLLAVGIAVGLYLLAHATPYYRAASVALLLPREKPTLDVSVNTSSMETGMDGARRESSGPLMLPPNPDLYTTILTSRPVLTAIADKFAQQLQASVPETFERGTHDIVDHIQRMLKITGTDEGMITIEVTASNRVLAANMANELLAEMERTSKAIERQLILQQSGFLETAQQKVLAELTHDEAQLAEFYARHGVIDVASQAADILRMKRDQEQALYKLEQEMLARLANFTENDDTVRSMQLRMHKHQARIEDLGSRYLNLNGEQELGLVQIEFDGLRERVRYKRDLLATIATQRSIFKIRAEQPAGSVAVLKSAMPPARASGPSRQLLLGIPILSSLLVAVLLTLLFEQWTGSTQDPYISRRIGEIRCGLRRMLGRSPSST
jgi:uncharacterized protein involved in exopolysaccharide biosynthesis